jgi:hypothetical protein
VKGGKLIGVLLEEEIQWQIANRGIPDHDEKLIAYLKERSNILKEKS